MENAISTKSKSSTDAIEASIVSKLLLNSSEESEDATIGVDYVKNVVKSLKSKVKIHKSQKNNFTNLMSVYLGLVFRFR